MSATADGLRFALEIVPVYIADRGLSSTLPKARWERIRQRVSEEHGHRCAACGISRWGAPLQCHEVWKYDPATVRPPTPEEVEARAAGGRPRWASPEARRSAPRGVRRLVDLVPLCRPCHLAKHSFASCFLFSLIRRDLSAVGRDSEPGDVLRVALAREADHFAGRTLAHFAEVNRGVPLAMLEAHCMDACALRDSRRDVEWASDYDGFDLLDESG